uniref:BTB domain-containing protein n=1 Tax=Oryzias melastigma TaxID=30732 RepID=A0A3B3BC43_ORYME
MDSTHPLAVLSKLNEQRSQGLFCDVTIVVEDVKFRAHKNILAACSRYFRNALTTSDSLPSPRPLPPAPLGGPRVFPGAPAQWDMPGTPLQGGVQEASGPDAQATSTGSSRLIIVYFDYINFDYIISLYNTGACSLVIFTGLYLTVNTFTEDKACL